MTHLTPLQQKISDALPEISVRMNEPLSRHTSFHIGGAAEVMAFPRTAEQLAALLRLCTQIGENARILGAGSNVLAPDEGISGVVICLKNALSGIEILSAAPAPRLRVYAGETMVSAALFAAECGFSGLEFAHGIPGTVGGGVYMNAGAYGGEIAQVCTQVATMDMQGNLRLHPASEMDFSYRHCRVQAENAVIVYADFALQCQPTVAIQNTMRDLKVRRSASQPLDKYSAGSAFKRPASGYAAAMIDTAGLKGFRIGGAAVSEKHAGFIVNMGDATAADVRALMQAVVERVEIQHGVRLEPEIRIW